MTDDLLERPLCVDLDGTLTPTDTLHESALHLFFSKPLLFLKTLASLRLGKAAFKEAIAQNIDIERLSIPFNQELVAELTKEKEKGRKLFLVTAANERIAHRVSKELPIFQDSVGSDSYRNLKGQEKKAYLVNRFGNKGFDYVGDHPSDLKVWQSAHSAWVVKSSNLFIDRVTQVAPINRTVSGPKGGFTTLLKAIRIHQWSKNILVFLPFLLAHKFDLFNLWLAAVGAAAFSLISSAVYLINDLADLEADRSHQIKRHRPLASGDLPVSQAVLTIPLLLVLGGGASMMISSALAYTLGSYFVLTLLYTMDLKRRVLLDAFTLAGLYIMRLVAGGAINQVPLSPWLIGFSLFFFLSLAMIKRYSELLPTKGLGVSIKGRGYLSSDMDLILPLGVCSGYISVLVMALFINSKAAYGLYETPNGLWLICPALLYWISRMWMLAHRGKMHSDPIVFTLKDPLSYFLGALVCACFLYSMSNGLKSLL